MVLDDAALWRKTASPTKLHVQKLVQCNSSCREKLQLHKIQARGEEKLRFLNVTPSNSRCHKKTLQDNLNVMNKSNSSYEKVLFRVAIWFFKSQKLLNRGASSPTTLQDFPFKVQQEDKNPEDSLTDIWNRRLNSPPSFLKTFLGWK